MSAWPLSPAAGGDELSARLGAALPTIEVRNRGGEVAAGIIGGMILGGIIASQRPHYYYEGYPPYAYYPAYRPYPMGGAAIDYCIRRFKSYDPYSMTYRRLRRLPALLSVTVANVPAGHRQNGGDSAVPNVNLIQIMAGRKSRSRDFP